MFALLASQPHYAAHLAPLVPYATEDADTVVVASYRDHRLARASGRRIVVMEHGVGQSYGTTHPSYPGGMDRGDAALFLTPNEYSAALWRARYPGIPVVAIGSPRAETLPHREPGPGPVIAIAPHWDCVLGHGYAGSAWREHAAGILALAGRYQVIGHGHPTAMTHLAPWYHRAGIEVVWELDEVMRRADVLVADNTSAMFEFAATGRPVVVLNSRRWAKDQGPGLRFWEAAGVGINVEPHGDLPAAVAQALEDPGDVRLTREAALDIVYAHRTGALERALDAIASLTGVPA